MSTSPIMVALVLSCLVGLAAPHEAHAQLTSSSATNFRFAETNELTIVVNLLGAVDRPGRYELSRSIDLLHLIALAGGSTETGDLSNVRIIRSVRSGARVERKEIRVNLDKPMSLNEADLALSSGDIIFVGRESGVTFSDVLSYLTTAAVLTTAIVTVINQTSN